MGGSQVRDLLSPDGRGLHLRWNAEHGFFVENQVNFQIISKWNYSVFTLYKFLRVKISYIFAWYNIIFVTFDSWLWSVLLLMI